MSLRRNPAYYKWWCYDCEEFVPENEVCLSVHTGPNGCQGDCTPAIEAPPTAKGKHIRTLEAQLEAAREAHQRNVDSRYHNFKHRPENHRCGWRVMYEAVVERSKAALITTNEEFPDE